MSFETWNVYGIKMQFNIRGVRVFDLRCLYFLPIFSTYVLIIIIIIIVIIIVIMIIIISDPKIALIPYSSLAFYYLGEHSRGWVLQLKNALRP